MFNSSNCLCYTCKPAVLSMLRYLVLILEGRHVVTRSCDRVSVQIQYINCQTHFSIFHKYQTHKCFETEVPSSGRFLEQTNTSSSRQSKYYIALTGMFNIQGEPRKSSPPSVLNVSLLLYFCIYPMLRTRATFSWPTLRAWSSLLSLDVASWCLIPCGNGFCLNSLPLTYTFIAATSRNLPRVITPLRHVSL